MKMEEDVLQAVDIAIVVMMLMVITAGLAALL